MLNNLLLINGSEFSEYENVNINKSIGDFISTSSIDVSVDNYNGKYSNSFNVGDNVKLYLDKDNVILPSGTPYAQFTFNESGTYIYSTGFTTSDGNPGSWVASGEIGGYDSGLSFYYKLNESGNTATDYITGSNMTNSNTTLVAGKLGSAMYYSGTSYSAIQTQTFGSSFSVGIWEKHDTAAGYSSFAAQSNTNYPIPFELANQSTGSVRWVVGLHGGTLNDTQVPNILPSGNTWNFLVGTYSTWNGGRLYLNGSLIGSTTGSVALDNAGSLWIGRRGDGANTIATIDDVRIWKNTEITQSDIQAIYNSGAPIEYASGAIAFGSELVGSVASVGIGYSGLVVSGLFDSGKNGSCINFDNDYLGSGYVELTKGKFEIQKLDSSNRDFTIAAWINGVQYNKDPEVIFSVFGSEAYYRSYKFGVSSGTDYGNLFFNINFTGSNTITSSEPIYPGSWYHVGVSRTGSVYSLFQNGSNLGSAVLSGNAALVDGYPCIGAVHSEVTAPDNQFKGKIDDVRFYYIGMDDNDFKGIYNNGIGNEVTNNGSQLIINGIIDTISKNKQPNNGVLELQGSDYSTRLKDNLIKPVYFTSVEISDIVKTIIASTITDITTNNVETTTVTLEKIKFNYTSLYDALTQLAELCDYYFYIDNDKDLHFSPKKTIDSGIVIDNTNCFNLKFDNTRDNMFNKIWVKGDSYTINVNQQYNISGTGSTFETTYSPSNLQVSYLGSTLRGGIWDVTQTTFTSGTKYYLDASTKSIIFVSGTTIGNSVIPSGGSFIANYDRNIPIVKYGQDNNSIVLYGPKEIIINDNNIKSPDTALLRLQSELNNTNPFNQLDFNLKGWYKIIPGDTVEFNLDDLQQDNVSILNVNYNINKESVITENILSITASKKFTDITDKIKNLNNRISNLENQYSDESDNITRLESSNEVVQIVGSAYNISYRDINDSLIMGHPVNGVMGILNGSSVGSLISGCSFIDGTIDSGYNQSLYLSGASMMRCGSGQFDISGASSAFSFWLKAGSQVKNYNRVFEKGGFGGNGYSCQLGQSGALNLEWYHASGTGWGPSLISTGRGNNVWEHYVVLDNPSGQSYIYKNGSIIKSGTLAYYGTTSDYLDFGNSSSGLFSIDDLRIYNRTLSSAEIGSLYNKQNVNGSLIAHYKFDEGTGSFCYNSAVSGDSTIQPFIGDRTGSWITLASGGYDYITNGSYNEQRTDIRHIFG